MASGSPSRRPGIFLRLAASVRTWCFRLFLPCMALAVLALSYGCWEAKQLECNHASIPESVMPGCRGLKIALIGDIHGNTELFGKAVDMVIGENPDLVAFTGDLYTASSRAARTRNMIILFQRLSSRFPTYACIGNHDMEKLPVFERIMALSGVTVLRNEKTSFHCPRLDKTITIAGLGDWNEYDFHPEKCLEPRPGDGSHAAPVLLLCHNPASRNELKDYRWNLMLGGHTHGYQARWPFTGKPVFYRDNDPFSEGYLPVEGSAVYATRGIGSYFSLRFFCPPEINILTVQ